MGDVWAQVQNMKLEEEVNLTGTGETNEGSRGKQEGEVQERNRRATRGGQWSKKDTVKKLQKEEDKSKNSQENKTIDNILYIHVIYVSVS